ncbi:MAG: nitrogenase component 1 [Acidaminococcaceae bacterium]|nr:nitrogenase component 1 [Acidaminococcaceae bacterium]
MPIKTKRFINKKRSCSCSMPGVWRAVGYSKGAVVIFHSPKACAHVSHTMDINAHFRGIARGEREPYGYSTPLISTMLTEKHSIFGGAKQLEKCLDFVVQKYKPQYIVIANSCVVGVIGDDVSAIAATAEEKFNLPIITLPCYGFLDGEYYAGYYGTADALVDRFLSGGLPRDKNSVILLGDNGGPNAEYAVEVKSLLAYFGLHVIGQFPGYVAYNDMNKVTTAALSIVLGGRGQANDSLVKIAKKLEEKFAIPFYGEPYPLGWQGTKEWLINLGAKLHKEAAAKKAIDEQKERLDAILSVAREKLRDKKIVICIGRQIEYFRPEWLMEILQLSEIVPLGVILLDSYTTKDRAHMEEAIKNCTNMDVFNQVEGAKIVDAADIILTTHEIENYNARQLFLPMLPTVGVTGMIKLINNIIKIACRHGNKGGIVYG